MQRSHHTNYVHHTTYELDAELTRLLNRLLERTRRPFRSNRDYDPGPARAHRFGHGEGDHDHGSASDVEADVLAAVRGRAGEVHERLAHDHDVFAVELVGSTGGGKTELLERMIERSSETENIGAIVGDVSGEDDAERLRAHGVAVENVNTGKECHLDPDLVDDALDAFDLADLDALYLENVGNMVCPADFPLGATVRLLVVSTTEGDDVVRKHPLLVQACDGAVVNKVDLAEAVGADVERIREDLETVAPGLPVFETVAREGDGVDELEAFLTAKREGQHEHHHAH